MGVKEGDGSEGRRRVTWRRSFVSLVLMPVHIWIGTSLLWTLSTPTGAKKEEKKGDLRLRTATPLLHLCSSSHRSQVHQAQATAGKGQVRIVAWSSWSYRATAYSVPVEGKREKGDGK